jgi:hypothetical protein
MCLGLDIADVQVTRDRLMLELDAQYPQYGFAQHKGYGVSACSMHFEHALFDSMCTSTRAHSCVPAGRVMLGALCSAACMAAVPASRSSRVHVHTAHSWRRP